MYTPMTQKILIYLLIVLTFSSWSWTFILLRPNKLPATPIVTTSHTVINSNTVVAWGTDQDLVASGMDDQQTKYVSQRLHFSWSLESAFSFMHFPPTEPATYAARFDRPNHDPSLKHNRQTLVGFNTKSYDEITLEVWPNLAPQLSQKSSIDEWSDVVGAHRHILEQSMILMNGKNIFRAIEMDGEAGAYGYYYYFISPTSLIVIGSTDISRDEIEKLLQTFVVSM